MSWPAPRGAAESTQFVAPVTEVAFELRGDGVAGGALHIGGVTGLLQLFDVLGHVGILGAQLIHGLHPLAGLTEQVTSPEAGTQDLLHAAEQGVLAFRVRGVAT